MPRSLPLMAAVCTLLFVSEVHADADDRLQLSWTAPSGCPQVAEVRARIRKLTGHWKREGAPVDAEATIVRKPNGRLHLTLVVRDGDAVGRREIDAEACDDLAGATAVNLALLLRSASAHHAEARDDSAQPTPDAASAQATAPRAAIAPEAPKRGPAHAEERPMRSPVEHTARSWHGLLRLPLMAASIGLLPTASWGASLAAGVRLERWSVFVDGGAWLRQSIAAPNKPDVSAHVDRIAGGVHLCHDFAVGAFELAPCAGISLQHVWSRGAGPHIAARTAQATWLAPGIGGQMRWPLTAWIGLVAGFEAQAQTARPKLTIDGVGRIGQMGPIAITFLLGSEWIL